MLDGAERVAALAQHDAEVLRLATGSSATRCSAPAPSRVHHSVAPR
jgi:hypothetical protein